MNTATPPALPDPASALPAWNLAGAAFAPLGRGLINGTWRVQTPAGPRVLQQLNPIFPPEVNEDIAAVAAHLARKGLLSPELLPTRDGRLWAEAGGHVWRLMTLVPGVSLDRLESPAQARAAGGLLARFHGALLDLDHPFPGRRPGVHDTARHLANLHRALEDHRHHPRYGAIAPLAAEILALAEDIPPAGTWEVLPRRVVHGDPKINNVLFSDDGREALCLVDLDTLGPMALPLELGDAFRSWCNPGGEDQQAATFDLELFTAAVAGYARHAAEWMEAGEIRAIVPATFTIYVELAARFCADALNESYFGWDPARFASRSLHNQVRASSQVAAARSLAARRERAEAVVARAFDSPSCRP